MNCDIDTALLRLTAVQDQRKRFDKWKASFSNAISRHLNKMFIQLANDLNNLYIKSSNDSTSTVAPGSAEYLWSEHKNEHTKLKKCSELMHWLKVMDRKAYDGLTKVYTNAMSKIYEREIKIFFDSAKTKISPQLVSDNEMNTSISSKFKSPQSKAITQLYGILSISKDQWTNGVDVSERQRFETISDEVLTKLEPMTLNEQNFCIRFFQLGGLSPTTKNMQITLDVRLISIGSSDGDGRKI